MDLPHESITGLDSFDPRRLLIFREVARRGSLSAAASALGWTQPAVGQHIHRLERDLGLALALRSTRGITLTDAGVLLLSHADAVASRLAAADQEMDALRTMRTGRLRLAAFPSAAATLLPAALVRLAAEAPGLDVWLTELEPPEALAAVLAGDIDLAVTFHHPGTGNGDRHPDLVFHVLGDDHVLAVLPREHPREPSGSTRGPLNLASLASERWIAGCLRCRSHLQALARSAGFEPDVRHTTDDYVVVQKLVAAGLAVALLPALALAAAPNDHVTAVPIEGNPVRQISLAHRKEATPVPAVKLAVHTLTASRDAWPEHRAHADPALWRVGTWLTGPPGHRENGQWRAVLVPVTAPPTTLFCKTRGVSVMLCPPGVGRRLGRGFENSRGTFVSARR